MRTGDQHSEQSRRWLAQTGQSVATVIAAILVTACLCGTAAGETPEALAEAVRVGEYARAEELARTHLEVHPADARAWFYLGFALAAQGRAVEALPAYREAVGLGLHEYQSLYQLGYAALLAGELELATESLEAAIAERSDAPEAWYRLGRARLEAKALEDAEAAFGQLIEGAPEEAAADEWQERARFQRAIVRIEQGRIEAASGDLRWVATHGRNPERKRRAALLLESASQLRRSASRWGLLWLEKTGYDSNVLRLPETSLTRSTEDGAATVTSLLMGSYDVLPDGGLTLRLSGLDVSYPGRREGAVDALLLAAENETRIGERVALLLTGNGEYYWAGREALFWRGGGKLGLRVHAPGDLWLGLGGTYTRIEYRPQVLADLDAHESSGFPRNTRDNRPYPVRSIGPIRAQPHRSTIDMS